MFAHLRVRGEWFKLNREMKAFIRTVQLHPEITSLRALYVESLKHQIEIKARKKNPKSLKLKSRIKSLSGA